MSFEVSFLPKRSFSFIVACICSLHFIFPACIAGDFCIHTNHIIHQPARMGAIFFIRSLDRSNRKQRKAHKVFLLQQRRKKNIITALSPQHTQRGRQFWPAASPGYLQVVTLVPKATAVPDGMRLRPAPTLYSGPVGRWLFKIRWKRCRHCGFKKESGLWRGNCVGNKKRCLLLIG